MSIGGRDSCPLTSRGGYAYNGVYALYLDYTEETDRAAIDAAYAVLDLFFCLCVKKSIALWKNDDAPPSIFSIFGIALDNSA